MNDHEDHPRGARPTRGGQAPPAGGKPPATPPQPQPRDPPTTTDPRTPHKNEVRGNLYARYDNDGLEHGEHLHGESFLRNVLLYEALEPEWTDAWLSFVYGYMYGRTVLDDKTRVMIVIAEGICAGHYIHITHHMNTAIKMGITPQEVLEIIQLSAVCAGLPTLRPALNAFRASMTELGLRPFDDPIFDEG